MRTSARLLAGALALALAACQAPATPGNGSGGGNASSAPAAPAAAPMNAAAFCARLQPSVQALVKPTLALFRASDSSTDPDHSGETAYVDCDFRQPGGQFDVSLHDDGDGAFDDPNQQGYAALAGLPDKARFNVPGSSQMRWVDVVRGKIACEARIAMADSDLNGDWKQAAGKACESALDAARG